MSFLNNQIKQGLPADLLSHTESGSLIDPHQGRVHNKIALHAQIERAPWSGWCRRGSQEARMVRLAHAGDEVDWRRTSISAM